MRKEYIALSARDSMKQAGGTADRADVHLSLDIARNLQIEKLWAQSCAVKMECSFDARSWLTTS